MDINLLQNAFISHFNTKPRIFVRAPGRVNLIGEHTDYNEGFVLPMAIDREVWMALTPRQDSQVRVYSLDYETDAAFSVSDLVRESGWAEYIKGVAYELGREGFRVKGFDAVMSGNIPRGAGLSSSAAVELAAARAFASVSEIEWDAKRMALISQKAENDWVGVQCGVMDQMASAASKRGYALFLDCRSLEIQHAPLPETVSIAILDTSTRRGLVTSAYNERRRQCEEAAKWFGVKALRDIDVDDERWKKSDTLNDVTKKRARHIVTENARTLESVRALKSGQIGRLGELFNASHASLRDDFEVTNDALNLIVECAQGQSGCYGARMTGAGFGGCAVALLEREKEEQFADSVAALYKERSGLDANIYICQPEEGASVSAF